METQIYTIRKLEKIVSKYIAENSSVENEYLGKWSANIFYINHKKCWLLINNRTKYILVLNDIKQSELKNISKIFKETFYSQLICDGIIVEYDIIEKIIGEIKLYKTDNDRSANGSINNCLLYFDDWKYDYGHYENMPFRELNSRLNSSPNKMLNWKYPKEEMNEPISAYAEQKMALCCLRWVKIKCSIVNLPLSFENIDPEYSGVDIRYLPARLRHSGGPACRRQVLYYPLNSA